MLLVKLNMTKEDLIFVYYHEFWQKSINHRFMGIFLDFHYSIDLCISLHLYNIVLITLFFWYTYYIACQISVLFLYYTYNLF